MIARLASRRIFWPHGPGSGAFLVGVEFADGRRASTLPGAGADGIVFRSGGGSGGEASLEQSWWLSPVPQPGPLRFVVRCAELGIEETAVELDGTAIAAAVADVETLWPWEPPRDSAPEPPPPDLPTGSWFVR